MSKIDNIKKVKLNTYRDEVSNKMVVSIDGKEVEFHEVVVKMNRVTKVVKGGRRFSFNAFSVVGDKDSYVGFGFGKAKEIVEAIRKSTEKAKGNIIRVQKKGSTIPYQVIGKFKSTSVFLSPCSPGTGIIAGTAVRSVVELGGIKDVLTKVQGSTNPLNIVKATIMAISQLSTVEEVRQRRNITLRELFGEYSYQKYKEKKSRQNQLSESNSIDSQLDNQNPDQNTGEIPINTTDDVAEKEIEIEKENDTKKESVENETPALQSNHSEEGSGEDNNENNSENIN